MQTEEFQAREAGLGAIERIILLKRQLRSDLWDTSMAGYRKAPLASQRSSAALVAVDLRALL